NGVAIFGLILAIIAIILVVVLYIFYFTQKSPSNSTSYNIVQGSGSSTFTGNSNTVFIVANGFSGTVTVNKPSSNPTGWLFTVANNNNSQAITLTGGTGVTITGSAGIIGNGSGTFLWTTE